MWQYENALLGLVLPLSGLLILARHVQYSDEAHQQVLNRARPAGLPSAVADVLDQLPYELPALLLLGQRCLGIVAAYLLNKRQQLLAELLLLIRDVFAKLFVPQSPASDLLDLGIALICPDGLLPLSPRFDVRSGTRSMPSFSAAFSSLMLGALSTRSDASRIELSAR